MLLTPNQVPMNHSFMCYASLTFGNFSTSIDETPYSYPMELDIDGVQIQAFNGKKTKNKFVEGKLHFFYSFLSFFINFSK